MVHELTHLGQTTHFLDVFQHVQAGFVGATVGRAPEAGHTGCNGCKRVGTGRAAQAHGRGGSVLFVVSMQDEDAVQRAFDHGVHHVLFTGRGEHHVHEVASVAQVVLRVHVGLTCAVLVGHGHQGGQLGNQADSRDFAVFRIVDVRAVVVERRQSTNQAGQDGHGVGVTAETAQEELHLLVDHGVVGHTFGEVGLAGCIGQVAVQQQVAGFHEVAVHGQLFNRVTAVQQFALVAVDVGDGGLAGRRRQKARVIGEHAGLGIQLTDVDHVRADGALVDRQVHTGAAVTERHGGFVVS